MSDVWQLVVIGAGAAGLMAAETAAARGLRVLLLEKNRRPGVKILMSGGTRCNLTHATDKWGIVRAYGDQGNFLHSALAQLDPPQLVRLFEDEGMATKVEDTGKIFPASDKATDVLAVLMRRLERSGAVLALEEPTSAIAHDGEQFLITTPKRVIPAEKLLITTGGMSYPGCGTTGDGYAWAEQFGHTIVRPRPALVPITTPDMWVKTLTGLTIPDMLLRVVPAATEPPAAGTPPTDGKPKKGKAKAFLAERRSSLLFTHFGLSGPAALDVSRAISGEEKPAQLKLVCDFLPDIKLEALEEQLKVECTTGGKKQLVAVASRFVPRRLAESMLDLLGLALESRAAELSKSSRSQLALAMKGQTIRVEGTRGFPKAEVTAGGVSLKEVDSHTMESKLRPGLFFAGEVLDLDGPIGGYNFQAAFSTAKLAGMSV